MEEKGLIAILLIMIGFLISLIVFIIYEPALPACNDGTKYDECSVLQPYFCFNGTLIENAFSCGCPKTSAQSKEICTSAYQTGRKDVLLNYTLNGERKQLSFTAYKGMVDYVARIERYVDFSENFSFRDFKLKSINEEQQREFLIPLVIKIENLAEDKEDQVRIAVSLVQNIPFGNSNKISVFGRSVPYERYPYEVLYDNRGVCGEKSSLLIFLLKEIGYSTASFYYPAENHEAVGIGCPETKGLNKTSYCFIETTGPSIISDEKTEYSGIVQLPFPQINMMSYGALLSNSMYEYKDAEKLESIRMTMREKGMINPIQASQFKKLKEKYGFISVISYSF